MPDFTRYDTNVIPLDLKACFLKTKMVFSKSDIMKSNC